MGQHLVDAPAGHDVAAKKQGDHRPIPMPVRSLHPTLADEIEVPAPRTDRQIAELQHPNFLIRHIGRGTDRGPQS
jgi:hypothetical protein